MTIIVLDAPAHRCAGLSAGLTVDGRDDEHGANELQVQEGNGIVNATVAAVPQASAWRGSDKNENGEFFGHSSAEEGQHRPRRRRRRRRKHKPVRCVEVGVGEQLPMVEGDFTQLVEGYFVLSKQEGDRRLRAATTTERLLHELTSSEEESADYWSVFQRPEVCCEDPWPSEDWEVEVGGGAWW